MKRGLVFYLFILVSLLFFKDSMGQNSSKADSIYAKIKSNKTTKEDSLNHLILLIEYDNALIEENRISELKFREIGEFSKIPKLEKLGQTHISKLLSNTTQYPIDYSQRLLKNLFHSTLEENKRNTNALVVKGIGDLYSKYNYHELAQEYYTHAYVEFQNLGNDSEEMKSLLELGETAVALNQFEPALNYLNECLDYFQENYNQTSIAHINSLLGLLMIKEKRFDDAIKYINQSQDLLLKGLKNELSAYNLELLGDLFTQVEDFNQAKTYYNKSDSLIETINASGDAGIKLKKAEIEYQQNYFIKSKKLLGDAIGMAKSKKHHQIALKSYQLLSKISYREKQYEAAYHYLKLSGIQSDSSSSLEKRLERFGNTLFENAGFQNTGGLSLQNKNRTRNPQREKTHYSRFLLLFLLISTLVLIVILLITRRNNLKLQLQTVDLNAKISALNKKNLDIKHSASTAFSKRGNFLVTIAHNLEGYLERFQHASYSEMKKKLLEKISSELNFIKQISQTEEDSIHIDYQALYRSELSESLVDFQARFSSFKVKRFEFPELVFSDKKIVASIVKHTTYALYRLFPEINFSSTIVQNSSSLNGVFYKIEFEFSAESEDIQLREKLQFWFNHVSGEGEENYNFHQEVPIEFLLSKRLASYLNAELSVDFTDGRTMLLWCLQLNGKEGEHAAEYKSIQFNSLQNKAKSYPKVFLHELEETDEYLLKNLFAEELQFTDDLGQAELIILYNGQDFDLDVSTKVNSLFIGIPKQIGGSVQNKKAYYVPSLFTKEDIQLEIAKMTFA